MNQTTSQPIGDLDWMAGELSRAIRRDHQRRARRRTMARTTGIVTAGVCALSGTALAAGELTGVVDLGGGHTAVPIRSTPAPVDPLLPYRYQLAGAHEHNGGSRGPIYIESSRPLTSLSQQQIAANRLACASRTMSVAGATVWVFDASCTSTR